MQANQVVQKCEVDPELGAVWHAGHRMKRVQVLGAGGAVGREVVGALLRAGHPAGNLALFAREPKDFLWRGQVLPVRPLSNPLPQADIAFLCTPAKLSERVAPILVAAGTRVIDLSGAHRWRNDVPMVEPWVRMDNVGPFTLHLTLPGRTSVIAARPLWVLERAAGIEHVVVTILRSSAAEGAHGILEQRRRLAGEAHETSRPSTVAASSLPSAGDVVPSPGEVVAEGLCAAEAELVCDLRQLFERPDLRVDASAVQVGVERCDVLSVTAVLRQGLDAAEAARLLDQGSGIRVHPGPRGPTPLECAGSDRVHVGRIRAGSGAPTSLSFFAVGDQLRVGAAVAGLHAAAGLPSCG